MTIHNNIEVLADSIIGALHGADLLAVDVIDTLDSDDLAELRGAIVPVLQSAAAAPDLTALREAWEQWCDAQFAERDVAALAREDVLATVGKLLASKDDEPDPDCPTCGGDGKIDDPNGEQGDLMDCPTCMKDGTQ